MAFVDKYISVSENDTNPDAKKIMISNDAWAIGEMMESIVTKINELMRRLR